jgi:hypothetical protein
VNRFVNKTAREPEEIADAETETPSAQRVRTNPEVRADRYRAHLLRTPTEVRHAMTYIRDNAKKHATERGETYSGGYVDPYSSAAVHDLIFARRADVALA